ncbi:MAG: GAF domain-containing protein [Syntrophaceae bacterium]|jgi:uncharacterized protein YigA (DUF484 family)|nr:GAF domain-containing protein [Syntrophaceae bacterium]HOC60677.1 GAF domain-containing protein [Smithellaceae bacterium]
MGKKEDLQRINEEIAIRFRKVEADVSLSETVTGLFEVLLTGIEREFGVPFVWLTWIDHEKGVSFIEAARASDILKDRLSIVSQELFEQILTAGAKPILANHHLQPFYKLMPSHRKFFIKSIAVVPFEIDGRVMGSWNNGDADAGRYKTDMDTSLLFSLAGMVSMKLSELALKQPAEEARPTVPDSETGP